MQLSYTFAPLHVQLLDMSVMDFENLIGFVIGKTSHVMLNAFHRSIQTLNLDVTLPQLGMLHYIYCHDEVTQQELAEITEKDKSSVLRLIDTLERKGYVTRLADANDRRKNIISISGEALEILEKVRPHILKHAALMTQNIPEADVNTCMQVLKQMQDNARQYIEQTK